MGRICQRVKTKFGMKAGVSEAKSGDSEDEKLPCVTGGKSERERLKHRC